MLRPLFLLAGLLALPALAADRLEYRVLGTSKTSTMEKEMNDAAANGFVFSAVMGGETSFGGKETVLVMAKSAAAEGENRTYKLLATSKTSTMQKELQQFGEEGYSYKGQTVFESSFGGREVMVILERDPRAAGRVEYLLVATSKTSTLQKELQTAGETGFKLAGMTVARTALGGSELVAILRR